MDIDALLIGALYSELTPADEARLTAHLESHPSDRAVLEDLKSARSAVRASRILEIQLEPPQSVSAMLLQEAARRAPRTVRSRSDEEKESWFGRFVASFMRHPAMAAAAMLVLVVGVAGTLYMKNGDQFAEKSVSATGPVATEQAPAGPAERARDEAERAANLAAQEAQKQNEAPAGEGKADDHIAAGSAATFDVDLAAKNQVQQAVPATVAKVPKADPAATFERSKGTSKPASHGAAVASVKKESGKKALDYIEVGATNDPSPKDMAFSGDAKSDVAKTKAGYKSSNTGVAQDKTVARGLANDNDGIADQGGATGGGKPTTASITTPGPANGTGNYAQPPPPPSKVAAKPEPKPAAQPQPGRNAPAATAPPAAPPQQIATTKPAADAKPDVPKKPVDDSLIAWAKGQHAQAVTNARDGKCGEAAKLALAVQNRAPDYYSQYMATDRALKPCQQYINDARDRDAEQSAKSRAQKRVNADAPAASSK